MIKDELTGMINIYTKQQRGSTEEDFKVLSSFFDKAARARLRANLFREIEKGITEQKKEDLQIKTSLKEKIADSK